MDKDIHKEKYCLNCGKSLKQIIRGRNKRYCNKNCQNRYLVKSGYSKRYMQTYMKKHPELIIKKRIVAREWRRVRHPEIIKFCQKCGKQLEGRHTKFCNHLCLQRFRQGYPKARLKTRRPIEEQRAYEKRYWAIPENKKRRKAALKVIVNKKRIKRIKSLERTLKILKTHQLKYEKESMSVFNVLFSLGKNRLFYGRDLIMVILGKV